MEKRKHLCTTSENVNYYTYYAKEDEELKKNPNKKTALKSRNSN
jgi:hypothetical protein